ncbi:hypothetical protein PROFUN_15799 [Planoprotostelium fungivorum]|uniref:Uncharacterized protein n=1 Tax=Planoprotostelium fungivorum TaxID=1890364 RepID=A0A2P6MUC0_9EUKA|nr:hypothetical protein PROFUN_15799 [Planoprotostelium fungivorum]
MSDHLDTTHLLTKVSSAIIILLAWSSRSCGYSEGREIEIRGLKHRLNIFQPTPDDKDPKYNPPWDPRYLGLVPKDVKQDTPQSNQHSTTQHKGKQHTLLPTRQLAEQRTTPPPTTAESSEEFQTMGYLVLNSLRPKSGRAFLHKSGKL